MDKYVEIQSKFSNYYFSDIQPKLVWFEGRRRFVMSAYIILFTIVAAIVGYLVFAALDMSKNAYIFLFGLTGFIFFLVPLLSVVIVHLNKVFGRNTIKKMFLPGVLNLVKYASWNNEKISPVTIANLCSKHNIVKINKNHFKSDDIISGLFNDIHFKIIEISLKYNVLDIFITFFCGVIVPLLLCAFWSCFGLVLFGQIGLLFTKNIINIAIAGYIISFVIVLWAMVHYSKRGRKINQYTQPEDRWFYFDANIYDQFKGLLVSFEYKKTINGHTVIFENNEENFLVKTFLTQGYEKVNLEDVEFNKKFSVYTTNQIDARYLLTTGFMERLKNLKQNFKSKYIRASFKNEELLLAIQADKNLFEMGSVWHKLDPKTYQTMFMELISILQITDALNLNKDIGL